jgi:hypothetical protein
MGVQTPKSKKKEATTGLGRKHVHCEGNPSSLQAMVPVLPLGCQTTRSMSASAGALFPFPCLRTQSLRRAHQPGEDATAEVSGAAGWWSEREMGEESGP